MPAGRLQAPLQGVVVCAPGVAVRLAMVSLLGTFTGRSYDIEASEFLRTPPQQDRGRNSGLPSVLPRNGAVMHILLIDDNEIFTAALAALLQSTGYRVSVTRDLEQSRQTHNQNPADLVLMCIDSDSPAAVDVITEELLTTYADTAVIGLVDSRHTSHPQYSALIKELGPTRVYSKPFRTEDLLRTIKDTLNLSTRCAP